MYPVSAFLTVIKANTRKDYWTGRIMTKAEDAYNFDRKDIVKKAMADASGGRVEDQRTYGEKITANQLYKVLLSYDTMSASEKNVPAHSASGECRS